MIASVWLLLSSLFYSLQLHSGSFPKPLSAEEERHYLELSAQGDLEARNILVERNLRLVAHVMKKYYAQTADQEDLISIGTIGLIKGITTFDASKGARLATYDFDVLSFYTQKCPGRVAVGLHRDRDGWGAPGTDGCDL